MDTTGLDPLQADAARAVSGDERMVLVVGPAGTGKTTTLARAVDDLHAAGRPVFGVAPTAKAARVLSDGTGMRTDTVAKLLHEWQRPNGPTEPYRLPAGATLIVDESGMLGTGSLDQLVALAERHRWRLALVGDPRQLQAVGRGGLFDELCRTQPVHELATIHRFDRRWEQTASLGLRTGTPSALDRYFDHDRVRAGSFLSLQVDTARRWLDAHHAGQTVAVVAETNSHVDALNLAIQAARRDCGHLGRSTAGIAGHEQAFVGDHVVTRRNDRTLRTDHDEPVRNRGRWTVQHIARDGSLTVAHHHGQGTVTLPADYVRSHVRLGYAATAHGNQGDTVDIGIAVVTPATSHRSLYVGATRGREVNRLLVVADDPAAARDVLERVLANERADVPAMVQRRNLAAQVQRARTPEDAVANARRALEDVRREVEPFLEPLRAAEAEVGEAEAALRNDQAAQAAAPRWRRRALTDAMRDAYEAFERAQKDFDRTEHAVAPHLARIAAAEDELSRAELHARRSRITDRLDRVGGRQVQTGGRDVGLGL